MADRWAVANGNWSNTATWNGGTLPTSADDVFADGFTVTVDQDITVLSIRTTQRSGGTAGGQFSISGTRTVNANVTAGTTDCLVVTATSASITINGNITGGSVSNADGFVCSQTNATFAIVGNVTGGSASGANGVFASNIGVVGSVTGSLTGGSNAGARGCIFGQGTYTFNGDSFGNTGAGLLINSSASNCTINGNPTNNNALSVNSGICTVVLGSSITGTSSIGNIAVTGGACVVSGGSLMGGSTTSDFALVISSGSCRVTGDVAAGVSEAVSQTGGVLYVVGNVQATTTRDAIVTAGNSSQLTVIGNVTGGTTGDGISSTLTASSLIVVHGTVTGGSSAGGHGISHTGNADIRIFGSEVAGAGGAAVNNTGTGTKTTTAVGGGGSASVRIVNVRGGADQ